MAYTFCHPVSNRRAGHRPMLTPAYFVEIKYQVQLAHIAEKLIQHLDEEVDGFEICQLVVVGVDAGAEE
jgi:hypothetical protein